MSYRYLAVVLKTLLKISIRSTDIGSVFRSGIRASWSLVHGKTINGNADAGLWGLESGNRENVVSDNAGGTVTGTGMVNLNGNLCNGLASCP